MKKQSNKQYLFPCLLAFLIPVSIMLILFIQRGIYPFGERSFMRTDLYHQYAPFHQMLRQALQNGESIEYTWNIGLGTNMISLFAYYLCSPFNLLLLFWPAKYVIEFISYGAIVKIGLAGATMTYYLAKRSNRPDVRAAFFGILYAMSGYVAAYSWNVMWLDCIWLFPLVVLGLERLIKEKKGGYYTLFLALAICTNYYIAIMICMFLVIYFVMHMIISSDSMIVRDKDETVQLGTTVKNYLQRFILFGFYSLLAGGIAAILLLPAMKALQTTASATSTFPKNLDSYFTMFEMLGRHLIGVETEQGLDHWPNIFCGIAPLVLLPLYVHNQKISAREKVCYFLMVLFFLFTFSLKVLNYIWHGFHFPNSLPARHSFLYIFLLLTMAYNGLLGLKYRTSKELTNCTWLIIGLIIVAELLITDDAFNWWVFLLSIIFAALYGGMLYMRQRRTVTKNTLIMLTMIVLIIEMTVNTSLTSITTSSRSTYTGEDSAVKSLVNAAEDYEDSEFFRIEKVATRTKNDGAWLDYNSGSTFSSSANAKMTSLYKLLGMEGSTNAYSMRGATPLTLALMNVKYSLSKNTEHESALRSLFAKTDNMKLYRNDYALELGFMVDQDLEFNWNSTSSNPIYTQNALALTVAGVDQMYYPTTCTTSTSTSSIITVDSEGHVYAYIEKTNNVKKVTARYNDNTTDEFTNVNRGYILDLGYHTAGETIYLYTEDAGPMTAYAYILNEDKMITLLRTLAQEQMVVDSYDNTTVNAHITTTNGGLLLTSIPYDPGFSVTVDGVEVEIQAFKDALISIPLTPGTHTLCFSYHVEGLTEGTWITIGSLLIFLLVVGMGVLRKKRSTQADSSAETAEAPAGNAEPLSAEVNPQSDEDVAADAAEYIQTDADTDAYTDIETGIQAGIETTIPADIDTTAQTDIETNVQTDIDTTVQTDIETNVQADIETND